MQTRLEDLTKSILGLESEVGRLRSEFRRRTLAIVAVVTVVAVVAFLFARSEINGAKQIARNNQRLCPVVKVLADPTGPQSSTPRGESLQRQFQQLAKDFHCPDE